MTALLFKLAFAGIRSRLLASALTIAIAGAAAATIVLALEVRSSGRDPWQQTFDAANGAHVLASVPSQADARAIANLPGVTERGAPVPLVTATLGPPGSTDRAELAGLSGPHSREHARADRRLAAARGGHRARTQPRQCARHRGRRHAGVHDQTRLDRPPGSRDGGRTQPAALPPPQPRPGLGHPRHARANRAGSHPLALDRGASTGESLRGCGVCRAGGCSSATLQSGDLYFETWQDQRDNALADAQPIELIVTTYTILLLIVAFVVVGILVGARASAQHREIGLLKAAGFTPRQVGAVFALESAALGLIAAALGFTLGMLLAPRLAAPSAETLIGSPTIAANPWHILVASCVVIPVLLAGTPDVHPPQHPLHRPRSDTAGSSSPPNSRLARAVTRSFLPLTIRLGLKDLLARGRRALLLAAAIALTGAVVVVALSLDATLDAQPAGEDERRSG